jgi:hypothetical protein
MELHAAALEILQVLPHRLGRRLEPPREVGL